MKKLDPTQSAEKIRKDLNGEFDADLEKAMGSEEVSGKQKEVSSGQDKETTKMKLSDEQMEALLKEGVEIEKKKKMEEVDEAGDLKLADKMKSEKEAPKEKLGEASDLELSDKIKKEAKKESSGEKLEALRLEVEKTRREYIEKDYEIDKKANIIYRALRIEGLGKLGLGNARDEVEEYKNNYEKALKDYKDAVINSEHVEDKEDVEMVAHWLMARERLNLRSEQTDLKMNENPIYEKFKKFFVGSANKYRKLCSLPGKIVSKEISKLTGSKWVGLGLGITAGAGAMGVALNQAGLAGNPAFRIFSGLISTVGFKQMLEAGAEKKRVKKEEEEIEKIKNTAEESESINFEKIKELLDGKISEMDNQAQSEKQWRQWRTLMAAGAGAATAFGGYWLGQHAAEFFQGRFGGGAPEVAGESGAPEVAKGSFSEEIARGEKLAGSGEGGPWSDALEKMREDGMPKAEDIIKAPENLEVLENVSLDVTKGSSLEGTLKTFLVANSEKLTEGNMGWDADKYSSVEEWAGKRAHIIAEEYAEANADQFPKGAPSLIHPGAEINLDLSNPADIQIDNIDDPQGLGYLGEKVSEAASAKTAETVAGATVEQVGMPAEMSEILGLSSAEYNAVSKLTVGEFLEKYSGNKDYAELSKFINGQIDNIPEAGRRSVDEFLARVNPEDSMKYLAGVLQQETAETIRICAGNNIEDWNNVKNVPAINFIDPETGEIQNEVVRNLKTAAEKVFPESIATPSNSDTVESWATKITKEAYKRGTLDELRE